MTIELRDEIPAEFSGKMAQYAFGCDICQQVCPWNRFARPHQEAAFEPDPTMLKMTKSDWEEITEEVFQQILDRTPVKRTRIEGLRKNIKFLNTSSYGD